jgi:hypothetical protein
VKVLRSSAFQETYQARPLKTYRREQVQEDIDQLHGDVSRASVSKGKGYFHDIKIIIPFNLRNS